MKNNTNIKNCLLLFWRLTKNEKKMTWKAAVETYYNSSDKEFLKLRDTTVLSHRIENGLS